tara:strand:+ start:3074 stop:3313 length:240 start_codon:yes stop_codon:yes gene_type:complete
MKPKYNPSLPIRCAIDYGVSYMLLSKDRVRMCVGKHTKNNKELEGNGVEFETLEKAREYAYNKGYLVYDEELGKENKKV